MKARIHPDSEYWTEHAQHVKRFYNIVCIAYGKDPQLVLDDIKSSNYQDLEHYLSIDGERCIELYNRIYRDWMLLLIPHFKAIPEEGTMG